MLLALSPGALRLLLKIILESLVSLAHLGMHHHLLNHRELSSKVPSRRAEVFSLHSNPPTAVWTQICTDLNHGVELARCGDSGLQF